MNRFEYYSKVQEYQDNHIEHHGIIGQKWGQRRWQNPDGTYTEEGKKRYFGSDKSKNGVSDDSKLKKDDGKYDHIKNYKIGKKLFNESDEEVEKFRKRSIDLCDELVDAAEKGENNMKSVEDKILEDPYVKKYYNKAKEVYNKTNDIDEVEKTLMSTPVADELQDTWLLDLMQRRLESSKPFGVQPTKKTEAAMNEILDNAKLGSISKPKINEKFLNEDGTLNDLGKKKIQSKASSSDLGSSIFKVLKYVNLGSLAIMGPATFALTLSGFGLPAAIINTLYVAGRGGGAALIDNALNKKLTKRADAYYDLLLKTEKAEKANK